MGVEHLMSNYIKTTWQDGVTPISAANLNKIENGIQKNSKENQFAEYNFNGISSGNIVYLADSNAKIYLHDSFQADFRFKIRGLPPDRERTISICSGDPNICELYIENSTSEIILGDTWNHYDNLTDDTYIIIRLTPVGNSFIATVKEFRRN